MPCRKIHGSTTSCESAGWNTTIQATGKWYPWKFFDLNETPLRYYRDAIVQARESLSSMGIGWQIGCYLNHSNPCPMLADDEGAEFLAHPIFLSGDLTEDYHPLIVDYDLEKKCYRLHQGTLHPRPPFPDHQIYIDDVVFPVDFDVADFGVMGLITLDSLICESVDPLEIADEINCRSFIPWIDD